MFLLILYVFATTKLIASGTNYENYFIFKIPPNLPLSKGGLSLRSNKISFDVMFLLILYVFCHYETYCEWDEL